MTYDLTIHKQARKKLLAMPANHRHKVAQAIHSLGANPDSPLLDLKLMQGSAATLWRMRVGDWRVIKSHNNNDRNEALKIIAIEKIGARGDVYK
jgi:mRNA interferase RelE/StbE